MRTAARSRSDLALPEQNRADYRPWTQMSRGTCRHSQYQAWRPDMGDDDKVLWVLAVGGWLASRRRAAHAGNHALLVTVAASLLPHALKALFDQTRPDGWDGSLPTQWMDDENFGGRAPPARPLQVPLRVTMWASRASRSRSQWVSLDIASARLKIGFLISNGKRRHRIKRIFGRVVPFLEHVAALHFALIIDAEDLASLV